MEKKIIYGVVEFPDGTRKKASITTSERDSEVETEADNKIDLAIACMKKGVKLVEYLGCEYV